MAVSITIGGENAIPYIDLQTIEIVDGAESRGDTASFVVSIPAADLGTSISKPRPGHVVVIRVDGDKYFEGPILTISDRWRNSHVMDVNVECVDYTFFLDRKYIAKVEMPVQLPGARIKALIEEFAPEFAWGTGWDDYISNGEVSLPQEGYDYEQFSSVIDRICESTGYSWHVGVHPTIDGRPTIHFYPATDATSPLNNAFGNELDLDTNLDIGGVEVTEDISDLHNVVIVKDFSEKKNDPYSEEYVADGRQTFFKLPMEPYAVEDTKVYVQPGGEGEFIPRTVALDPLTGEEDEIAGQEGYVFVCLLNWGLRFPTVDYPSEGDVVRVEYNYVIPDRIIPLYDLDSINEMARREGNDGEHQVVVSLPDYRVDGTKGWNAAEYYGYMILNRHAWPEISGSFTVLEPSSYSELKGWQAGQYFGIISTRRDIYDIEHWVKTGRGEKRAQTVWITRVRRRIAQTISETETRFRTTVEFSTTLRK